jgi:hypothetical protein
VPRVLAALGSVLVLTAAQGAAAKHGSADGSADQKVIKMLASIAAHQTHGWSGDTLPLETLEVDVTRGHRILVSCGTVAHLGVRAARRTGFASRLVGSFTRQELNGFDDGHVMLEVRLRRGWTVFDLDTNRRAPAGIGISELVQDPRWRTIARDPLYDEAEVAAGSHPDYDRAAFAHLGSWYRRVLGVPTIFAGGSIWFHDARYRSRGLSLGYRWARSGYWRRLND